MKFLLIFFFALLSVQTAFGQSESTLPGSEGVPFRSPFRYVIVSGVTDLDKYVNRFDDDLYIEVLIEDAAFNEDNLRNLFKMLSERFADQSVLSVWVYTSMDAIKTPEETDHSRLKGPIDNYKKYKFAHFLKRSNKCDAYFRYAEPGQSETKITLKCDTNGELVFNTEDSAVVSDESATDCEEGRRMIDNALYEIRDEAETKIEFVLHNGVGEAKKIADERERYVLALCNKRGFPEKCSVRRGDDREGLGAIDLLIKGDPSGTIYFRKNEPSPCPNPANWDIF